MELLMKTALRASQMRQKHACQPTRHGVEVYLRDATDLATDAGVLEVMALIEDGVLAGYDAPADYLRMFHLPFSIDFRLEGILLNDTSHALVRRYVRMLHAHLKAPIRLLTHVSMRPQVLRELGLETLFLERLQDLLAEDVYLYLENGQILTEKDDRIGVFPTWAEAVFDYKVWLNDALNTTRIQTVVDICHLLNSGRVLQTLGKTTRDPLAFTLDFLSEYWDVGVDHVHLANGRDIASGSQSHGCGYDTDEEQQILIALLRYLHAHDYDRMIVIETNDADVNHPHTMCTLAKQTADIWARLEAEC